VEEELLPIKKEKGSTEIVNKGEKQSKEAMMEVEKHKWKNRSSLTSTNATRQIDEKRYMRNSRHYM